MSYEEFKKIYRNSWEDEYSSLRVDSCEKKKIGGHCVCNVSKDTYIECTTEATPY